MSDDTTINQTADRLLPYVRALTEEELRRLESLIIAELNARALRKKKKV